MDLQFFRSLCDVSTSYDIFCIYRDGDAVVVCSQPSQTFNDILDISSDDFVTGYQKADGQSGRWYAWEKLERIDAPYISGQSDHVPLSGISESSWETSLSRTEFISTVETMIEDMKRGEYFLANLTRLLKSHESIDLTTAALWSCLIHDSRFRFFLLTPDETVLGLSPERFFSIDDREILCEPIKGTAQESKSLEKNDKEHNENTMMIDLVRSDLAQICTPDSIEVLERDRITLHPGLVHMSSVIRGTLAQEITIPHAICTMMPIASVTGTPKPYVLKKIPHYEKYQREIYCGTYGWINMKSSRCDLAVGIRTIHTRDETTIGIGSGITIASSAESEYYETELKASRLIELTDLSRTSFLSTTGVFTSFATDHEGHPVRLQQHCVRLAYHASRINISLTAEDIENTITQFLARKSKPNKKIKVIVDCEGKISCETSELPRNNSSGITLAISPFPKIGSRDVAKFTDRSLYDNTLATARNNNNAIDDTLLCVHGYITETTRSNIFLLHDSTILTPDIQFGVLEGVTRMHILDKLRVEKTKTDIRPLTLGDIASADEMIVCNSLRGVERVASIDSPLLGGIKMFEETNRSLFDMASQYV